MYFLLILFFGSIIGISFLVGKKIILLRKGNTKMDDDFRVDMPDLKELKYITINNVRRHGYNITVKTVRTYVLFSSFVKNKYKDAKAVLNDIKTKYIPEKERELKEESSKFLKMISEYKHKIRKIKHQIKKEEGIE